MINSSGNRCCMQLFLFVCLTALASCGATLTVRVQGPEGARIAINGEEPRQVPFMTSIRKGANLRTELTDDVLSRAGLSQSEIAIAHQRQSTVILGKVRVFKSRDKRATLELKSEDLKKAVLADAVMHYMWTDTQGRKVLTFEGRAEIK